MNAHTHTLFQMISYMIYYTILKQNFNTMNFVLNFMFVFIFKFVFLLMKIKRQT